MQYALSIWTFEKVKRLDFVAVKTSTNYYNYENVLLFNDYKMQTFSKVHIKADWGLLPECIINYATAYAGLLLFYQEP